MTDFDANRLILMLTYNFAGFMPADVHGAAIKKGEWMTELMKYDADKSEKAVKTIIRTMHYPPQIADFLEHMGGEMTRDDLEARKLIEYHPEEDKYPDDLVIQSGFERAMRAVNESVPMTGNHFDVAEEYEKRKARG